MTAREQRMRLSRAEKKCVAAGIEVRSKNPIPGFPFWELKELACFLRFWGYPLGNGEKHANSFNSRFV